MKQNTFILLFLLTSIISAQHQDKVDFIHADVEIRTIPSEKKIEGTVTYTFKILSKVDSVFLDAKNMDFSLVRLNGRKVRYDTNTKVISITKRFKKGKEYRLKLVYTCVPSQTVYFVGWDDSISDNEQIWTQGQGKYTSHWLPSFDDMEEKVEFDLNVITNKEFQVISNGKLTETGIHLDSLKRWTFNMQKPMSSYLLAFAIGNYNKQELTSKSGIPIENYFYPKDSLKVESTYRYTKEIFDFLEEEIIVPYPWQNYKQIPVHDFLYAGMENTTATIFSDGYVIDSTAFVDKNYVNVNAHELAHQWFGNLVTEKDGNHHWLHEGFATYYAYLAEKEIFGDDHFRWKIYNALLAIEEQIEQGKGESLLNPKASSLTFYEKGALALFMLRERIGSISFRLGMKKYLEKYQYKNATVDDFLLEMEYASNRKLDDFRRIWLESKDLPVAHVKSRLAYKLYRHTQSKKDENSMAVKYLIELESMLENMPPSRVNFDKYWNVNSVHLKKHMLEYTYDVLPEAILLKAFESDTVPIRQVLARKMDRIPPSLKTKFESLLFDKSYVTIEHALFKLWSTYPKEKAKYLEQTKDIIGLPNKNIRLLWLTLAIVTNDYDARNTKVYFQELSGYTSAKYGWEIRKGAFQYLHQTLGLNTESLQHLIQASVHHSWQFKKFARNLVDELLEDPDYKARFLDLAKELKGEELHYMNTKLEK